MELKKREKIVYEETPYPSIEQAYDELTQEGFGVWIRLMVATPDELCSGKLALSVICNYSAARFYKIMKELYNKDYIKYEKSKQLGTPHRIILNKKAMISGRTSFVKLSSPSIANKRRELNNTIFEKNEEDNTNEFGEYDEINLEDAKKTMTSIKNNVSMLTSKGLSSKQLLKQILSSQGRVKYVENDTDEVTRNEKSHKTLLPPSPVTPPPNNPKNNNNNREISSFATQNEDSLAKPNLIRARARVQPKTTKLSKKMAEKHQEMKKAISEKRKSKEIVKSWKINYELLESDYDKFDSNGDPSISFDPKSPRRDSLLEILEAKTKGRGLTKKLASERKKAKTRTETKLGSEFARIYIRYRNLINSARKRESRFVMAPGSEKYCAKIAVQCIYNEITPRQLLEYWDENIKHFHPKTFKHPYPTLSFLCGTYASEQVAAALFEKTDGGRKKWKSGDFSRVDSDKTNSHSFFNTSELDNRLKAGLVEAGYEIGPNTKYDDRYLITIQKTAIAIANGKKLFVSGAMRGMVRWAVDNLYTKDS